MKIKHLKEWLSVLPESYNEAELVFRNITKGDNEEFIEKEGEYYVADDVPISACGIDEQNFEAYFCDKISHSLVKEN